MSDFTSNFWVYYVAIITVVSIAACAVLLQSMSRRRVTADPDKTGHVWDEDLEELNNPLPRWWIWLFYITIIFSLVYLVLYPGLGNWPGLWKWSSSAAYQTENTAAEQELAPMYARYAGAPIEKLAADPQAMALGQRLFLNNCAQCHASDGAGSKGFPNLTDNDWLWGGDPATIEKTILDGRNGVMPPFGPVLGDQGVHDVANYVRSLSGLTTDTIKVFRGKELFMQNCVGCHGSPPTGNQAMGAPNLTDKIWLYGSSEGTIVETVTGGRVMVMPAHRQLLGEARVHVLAAYVYSLSHPAPGQ